MRPLSRSAAQHPDAGRGNEFICGYMWAPYKEGEMERICTRRALVTLLSAALVFAVSLSTWAQAPLEDRRAVGAREEPTQQPASRGGARNDPPILQNGSVDPEEGDLGDTFDFDVEYIDPEGYPPDWIKVYIDGASHNMFLISGLERWYRYSTDDLEAGVHEFYFRAKDIFGAYARLPPGDEIFTGPVVNPTCGAQLINESVEPEQLLYDDQFEFFVEYDHPLETPPDWVRVVIDGTGYSMTHLPGSTYIYTYMTPLEPGPHKHHFEAFKAEGGLDCFYRLPETGEISGPWCVLDQQKLLLDQVGKWILYYTDEDDDGWHDPEEPYYDGDHPVSNDWNDDLSCWMASAANLLECEGLPNAYETWLGTGGAPSPVTTPWGWTSYASGGGDARTFDDGGFQSYCLMHASVGLVGPIVTETEFGIGDWSQNPVSWCQARFDEGLPVGLCVFWGSPYKGVQPGWVSDSEEDGYHAITLWGIDTEAGTVIISNSDDFTDTSRKEVPVIGPRVHDYTYSGGDWKIYALHETSQGVVIDVHVNYAVAYAPATNHPPELTECSVDPTTGTPSTAFHFSAHYFDEDQDAPVVMEVTIDGSPYAMALANGDPHNGTYSLVTANLAEGSYTHHFYCEDGNGGSDRCPDAGEFDGPDVTPISEGWEDVTTGPLGGLGNGDGAAWGDYDADGDLDLYLANHSSNQLLRNDGLGVFTDVTVLPLDDPSNSHGAAWCDYDNDGDLDLYLCNEGPNRLFRNDNPGFTDVATGALAGVDISMTPAWADYDGDGWVDLFVCNYGQANVLLRNTGLDDVFEEATVAPLNDASSSNGAAWCDYDSDGDPDLCVANADAPLRLYRNDGGSWTNVAAGTVLESVVKGNGPAWGDYDNDGDLDLYVTNHDQENKLFRNEGGPDWAFVDATTPPLNNADRTKSVAWADYDNDGDLDLYMTNNQGEANKLLRNDGGGVFSDETSPLLAASALTGRAVAWGDYDQDGDLDLYVATYEEGQNLLFRNDTGEGNHWLHVELEGELCNRTAVGATVRATTARGVQVRELRSGSGRCSQSSLMVEFGLASASSVDLLEVEWPSPSTETTQLVSVGVDQVLHVSEAGNPPLIVDPEGGGDYVTIQEAVDAAQPGDTILLVPGEYVGAANRSIDPAGKAITIKSQESRETAIINCEGQDRGIYCHTNEDTFTVFQALTILNGVGPTRGGGVYCKDGASPKLVDIAIEDCTAPYGAGICARLGSAPKLVNVRMTGNVASQMGGGMFCVDTSSPTLLDCVFTDNEAQWGGGLACNESSSPSLQECWFSENSAGNGGGAYCDNSSGPVLEGCLFWGNWASAGGGFSSSNDASAALTNCTFHGNAATSGGGVIRCEGGSTSTLENTIVAFSTQGSAVVYADGGTATLTCCDVYGNEGGNWTADIADQYGIGGNISENPLFCDAGNGDYTLSDNSPCAAENNPECGQIGAFGLGGCLTGVDDEILPTRLVLYPSMPNPFRGVTEIRYAAPAVGERLSVSVYNIGGQHVRTVLDEMVAPGLGSVIWDGRDEAGRRVSAGVYFCRAVLWADEARTKLILLK